VKLMKLQLQGATFTPSPSKDSGNGPSNALEMLWNLTSQYTKEVW